MKVFVFIIAFCQVIFNCEASNILALFSHPGFSHFVVFRPIVEKLAEIGHTVTVVSYFPLKDHHENYREIIIPGQPLINSVYLTNLNTSRSLYTLYKEFIRLSDRGHNSCRTFYNSSCPEKILRSHQEKPFDLIIYEVFDTDCFLGIAYLLPNVPVIGISSCVLMPWHYDRIGLLDFPSFIPSEFVGFSEKMSYFDRFSNFISTKSLKLLYRFNELRDNEFIRQHLKINVDIGEIAVNRTNLLFVNSHYSIHAARPLMGQVVEILGVHIPTKSEQLTEDLSKFLDEAQHGVIFISWGSMVRGSSMTKENFHAIVAALTKFPQRIVWKWEVDQELIKDSSKFFFSSWFPQKDLLCHPKVKMFWSHGGLLGLSEACYCSVPMVVTPIYGDQFLNGKATENRGVGKILPYNDINEENVYQAISQVLKEEYSSNMKQLSKTFRNRQNSPLETAIWWIEHIIETGGDKLLRSASVDMNWFAYYSIDVISVLIGIILLLIAFLVKLAKSMRNLCCGNNNKRQHPKMKSS